MSYWILPSLLSDELRATALQNGELVLPAEGLADISRAQGPDQINDWLRHLNPQLPPEVIAAQAEHYWRLGHELLPEDTIIARVRSGKAYLVGEVTGLYRKEERPYGTSHVWPVKWNGINVAADSMPALAQYAAYTSLTEVSDEHALISLRPYVAALRKGNAGFFKWLAIIILIFELIYFWPHE